VDYLADAEFPVQDVTIVGVEPMIVERVTARLTWSRVLAGGAASGGWFGMFVGLLLGVFSTGAWWATVLFGLIIGVAFGMVFAAVSYASLRGQRDFLSSTQLVAGRYDVLCEPRNAEDGKALLAKLAISESPSA
jgi:hypothetical protein